MRIREKARKKGRQHRVNDHENVDYVESDMFIITKSEILIVVLKI